MMTATFPMTKNCHAQFEKKDHACFGISPFNSYFSEARIEQLARWGKKEFQSMHFFIPDIPSVYTLEAIGYETEKAEWKARRQSQYLLNKTVKALKSNGFNPSQIDEMILNWGALSVNSNYLESHKNVQERFELDEIFKKACMDATSWVLEGKLPYGSVVSPEQANHAVKYLLAEIPLFIDTAGIVNVNSSVFCYHQHVPFIEKLVAGEFNCQKNQSQGFLVIKPADIAVDNVMHKSMDAAI